MRDGKFNIYFPEKLKASFCETNYDCRILGIYWKIAKVRLSRFRGRNNVN